MAKGRKKTPDALKTLRGTAQPCRMAPAAAGLEKVTDMPRSGLKGTAKKVFELAASELIHKGILEAVGLDLVAAYAREMALYHDLMREMEREDSLTIQVHTKNGVVTVINSRRKLAEAALSNARSLASEFGLTPASRGRIAQLVSPQAPKDDFAEFEEVKDSER